MMAEVATPELDSLASELEQRVRHAAAARSGAALAAQFETMRSELESATSEIEECLTVLLDSPSLELPGAPEDLEQRKAWVAEQLGAVRTKLAENPAAIRQGDLWRSFKRAIETLRSELVEARALAYATFLDQFPAGDRELFESLPPEIPGVREYGEAIDGFERARDRLPRTVEEVARAAAAGRRLAERRDHVENEAVPPEFRDDWRALRGEGLALPELSEPLRAWLEEHDLAGSVLLRYRSP